MSTSITAQKSTTVESNGVRQEIIPAPKLVPTLPATVEPPPRLPAVQTLGNLAEALAAARDRCKAARKDGRNAFHNYDYSTCDEVIDTAKESLAGTGLALLPQSQELAALGGLHVLNRTWLLAHKSGEAVALHVKGWPVVPDKGRPIDKAFAGALSSSFAYILRDLLQMRRGEDGSMDARDDRQAEPAPPAQQWRDDADPQQAIAEVMDGTPPPERHAQAASEAARQERYGGRHVGPDLSSPATTTQAMRIRELLAGLNISPEDQAKALKRRGVSKIEELTVAAAGDVIVGLEKKLKERTPKQG